MKLNQQILKKYQRKSPLMAIAEQRGVSYDYVWRIAAGARTPSKKKGLEVLNDLKQLAEAGK